MSAHEQLKARVEQLEQAVNALGQNSDVLYRQFRALGNATGEALTAIETRLTALEEQTAAPEPAPDESAVPV